MLVKIKTWAEMKKEFGVSTIGDIKCLYSFTETMEYEMPENRIIEIIKEKNEWVWNNKWSISKDMIKEEMGAIVELEIEDLEEEIEFELYEEVNEQV